MKFPDNVCYRICGLFMDALRLGTSRTLLSFCWCSEILVRIILYCFAFVGIFSPFTFFRLVNSAPRWNINTCVHFRCVFTFFHTSFFKAMTMAILGRGPWWLKYRFACGFVMLYACVLYAVLWISFHVDLFFLFHLFSLVSCSMSVVLSAEA